ncbi:Argonaute siRNA chaperone complex subunit Arb1-domain-containing protein [Xylariaceae sp. FL0662B]|nr:Argonaute siRNA chaperone complex subunit Arb1-domain-containing protein [Xylariaceae sp. FL0662B]
MAIISDEPDSSQSGGKHDGKAGIGTNEEASLPSDQCKGSDGRGSKANGSPASKVEDASEAEDFADIGATVDRLEESHLGEDPEKKKKKKKKRNKRTGAAARKNVTGFEEFYADAPMTPADAAQEKNELYAPSREFNDRIEDCIQRFRASRRLDTERTNMFNKYLFMGGIDSSRRQFTGFANDTDALAEADADEIRRMTAIDYVGGAGLRFYDPLYSDHWEVDFTSIVKGFLSRTITQTYMYEEEAIQKAADLVKNFLNYVMRHDVCPEYIDDLMAAKNICDIAPVEMRALREIMQALPGTFNTACRTLFCDGLVNDLDKEENLSMLFTFRLTVLLWGHPDQKAHLGQVLKTTDPADIRVIDTKEEVYEVLDVTWPRRKDVKMVQEQLEVAGEGNKVQPAGILTVKPSVIEFGYDNSSSLDEDDFSSAKPEMYVLESDIITKFEKGMKIKLVVCELNVGIRFIKEALDLRVSFDTFLPQSLMMNWKDPVKNDRPPPSVSDPNAEQASMDAEAAIDD